MSQNILEINSTSWTNLNSDIFFQSTDGTPSEVRTLVAAKLVEEGIKVKFTCLDAYYQDLNSFKEDNTDLWRQEVFEVFIAAGEEIPTRYLELEINPNNAFFSAWVENATGTKPDSLEMIATKSFKNSVTANTEDWSGEFIIPFETIGKSKVYRINFYRIALHTRPEVESWECDTHNCYFLCWNSTMSRENPAFHRPNYFGKLIINE